ncbi:MAG: MgtC/SapB family protein [Akkermansiaceae bacterium]
MIDFDFSRAATWLTHLSLAYALSLPIGWDREKVSRSAGIRTFPLIAVSACAFVLMASSLSNQGSDSSSLARVFQGVVTGLGFLGGGVILKNKNRVMGMSTAAAIWLTGALGVSCGLRYYETAIVLSIVCFLSLRYGKVVKGKNGDDEVDEDC